jgi:hypothetical protein
MRESRHGIRVRPFAGSGHSSINRGSLQGQTGVPMADEDDDSSGWETASDDGDALHLVGGEGRSDGHLRQDEDLEMVADWDVRRCLFDNHVSETMDDNLEYMWKHYGFYLPDAEYLEDPEGLLKYLVRPLLVPYKFSKGVLEKCSDKGEGRGDGRHAG